jgi:hypothetical protein
MKVPKVLKKWWAHEGSWKEEKNDDSHVSKVKS